MRWVLLAEPPPKSEKGAFGLRHVQFPQQFVDQLALDQILDCVSHFQHWKLDISFRQVDPSDGDVQSEAMPLKPGVVFGKEYVGHKTANKSKGTVIAGMSMFAPRHLAKANQSIN